MALGGGEHKFVKNLFEGLNRPEFIESVTGPAGDGHKAAIAFLRSAFLERTLNEWTSWFDGRDICWSPVFDLKEAWEQSHVAAREMRVQDDAGNDHIGIPIKFTAEPGAIDARLSQVGANTAEILSKLDLTEAQCEAILEHHKSCTDNRIES